MSKKPTYGHILPDRTLILFSVAGQATCGKDKYEMQNTMAGEPMVLNKKNNRRFILPWKDILNLAHEAGIDEKEKVR